VELVEAVVAARLRDPPHDRDVEVAGAELAQGLRLLELLELELVQWREARAESRSMIAS
jgi:hypothetical protein